MVSFKSDRCGLLEIGPLWCTLNWIAVVYLKSVIYGVIQIKPLIYLKLYRYDVPEIVPLWCTLNRTAVVYL